MPSSPLHRHRPRLPGEPNIPVKASDELARAILEDQLEPFKSAIEAKMAGFRGHRTGLLSHLHDAYDLGPKAEPFDEEKSWFRIETIAYQYFALQKLKQTVIDREARYRAISNATQLARDTMEKARWGDHAGNELKAWLEGTKEFAQATEQFEKLLNIEVDFGRELDKVMQDLTELEIAANQLADEFHRGPGRPKGSSEVPWIFLRALEEEYLRSTGVKPKMTVGRPYAKLVEEFLAAIGRDDQKSLHHDYVVEKRRYVRKQTGKSK
jgi:hypothetical protein